MSRFGHRRGLNTQQVGGCGICRLYFGHIGPFLLPHEFHPSVITHFQSLRNLNGEDGLTGHSFLGIYLGHERIVPDSMVKDLASNKIIEKVNVLYYLVMEMDAHSKVDKLLDTWTS
jgi:hypothetical protein